MTHHWEALGWTLVHFCWQAAAIALVYKLADFATSKSRSSNVRYLLVLAAMLLMLLAAIATLAYEETASHRAADVAASSGAQASASDLHPDIQIAPRPMALIEMPSNPQNATQWMTGTVMPYLDGLWLLGVLALSIRTFGGWWMIRCLRHSVLHRPPHIFRIGLDRLRLQMKISRFVDLRLSNHIASPLTVGIIRPLILLPVTVLTSLSPEQLEVILAHELAHIRRADYFWNIMQTMIETLFFFHPAVWWISRRAREERELCCDDVALETCSDPTVYAAALLRLEEQRKMHLHLAMALDGNQPRTGLRSRILRILGDAAEQPSDLKPLSFVSILAAVALFLCPLPQLFASFKPVSKATPVQATTPTTPQNPSAARTLPASPASAPAAVAVAVQETSPAPAPAPELAPTLIAAAPAPTPAPTQSTDVQPSPSGKGDYILQMKAAGYDVDLDKYIAMKVQGITPQYASEMAKAAARKPSTDELIAMKVQGITPDYMSQMAAAGYSGDMDKFIAMKVQGITPQYAEEMAKAGFGKPGLDDLIALKVQNVTPEYAAKLRADGIEASSFSDLISYRIFNVSPEFVVGMKDAGYGSLPAKKLLALRVQGVTPEYAKSVKQQFPTATSDELIQLRVFHIDGDFIASAKRHGFEPLTIDKLVKLRVSGVLNDNEKESQ